MLFLVGGNGGSSVRGVWGGEGLPSCILVDCLHFSGINCCWLDLVDDCAPIFWIGGVVPRWGRGELGGRG